MLTWCGLNNVKCREDILSTKKFFHTEASVERALGQFI